METPYFVKAILLDSMIIIGLVIGAITYRHLSVGQKIIYTQLWVFAIFDTWAAIRIINGLYSIPVYSIGSFFFHGIELIYVDYELNGFRKKKLFRTLGIFLLICIPAHWIIVRNLNYFSDALILIHLFLSSFLFYCIINRPTNSANQMLRWALLIYWLGDLLNVVFQNLMAWKMDPEFGRKIMLIHHTVTKIKEILIIISFLMAYFRRKKLQLQA
jgi:hypothetical protein